MPAGIVSCFHRYHCLYETLATAAAPISLAFLASHPQLIKALALRVMTSIRVPDIIQIQLVSFAFKLDPFMRFPVHPTNSINSTVALKLLREVLNEEAAFDISTFTSIITRKQLSSNALANNACADAQTCTAVGSIRQNISRGLHASYYACSLSPLVHLGSS